MATGSGRAGRRSAELHFIRCSVAQSLNATAAKMSTRSPTTPQNPPSEDGLQQQGQFYKYWPFYTRVHRYTCNECWRRVNASACSGGSGKKGSRGAATNTHWAVEWAGGRGEKRIHTFCPPPPSSSTHSPTHPLLSPLPHYLHSGKSADKRDNPPSGRTSLSQFRLTKSDGCLIVRDTDRGLSLSNLKQIASPWGGD